MARLARVVVPDVPNHVHLVVVPDSEDGLRRGIGEAHRRYSRRITFHEGWYLAAGLEPDAGRVVSQAQTDNNPGGPW